MSAGKYEPEDGGAAKGTMGDGTNGNGTNVSGTSGDGMRGNGRRKIRALRELQHEVTPPRDLWPQIQARLAQESVPVRPAPVRSPYARRASYMRVVAAAAMVAALGVGVWIGRYERGPSGQTPMVASTPSTNTAQAVQAAYQPSAKYVRDRAALVKSLEAKLDSLPPDTRAKVLASLTTIQKSKQELETALGHDPTNALLQELLVDAYQDEMRVLTAVHEAAANDKGI